MRYLDCGARMLAPGLAAMLAGCSPSPQGPCDLLTGAEVRAVDELVVSSDWMPGSKDKSNELCMFYDAEGERRFMLFYWHDPGMSAHQIMDESMPGSEHRVVSVAGVGDEALAGLQLDEGGQELRMLTVRARTGTIGFRIRKPVREHDREYEALMDLAGKALSRRER